MPAQETANTDGQLRATGTLSLSDATLPGSQPGLVGAPIRSDDLQSSNLDASVLDEILLGSADVYEPGVTPFEWAPSAHTESLIARGIIERPPSHLTETKAFRFNKPAQRKFPLPIVGKRKSLFGTKGWLDENPEAGAKYLMRKAKQQRLHNRKVGIVGTSTCMTPTWQSVSNISSQAPKSGTYETMAAFEGPTSLKPAVQKTVIAELDIIIRETANSFLTAQAQAGRIDKDAFDMVRASWAQIGNLPVDGFNYDQFHQMRLLMKSLRFVQFPLLGQKGRDEANDILRGWPYLAEAAVPRRVLEMSDAELRVRLHDAERLLALLGAKTENLQLCREVAESAIKKMA